MLNYETQILSCIILVFYCFCDTIVYADGSFFIFSALSTFQNPSLSTINNFYLHERPRPKDTSYKIRTTHSSFLLFLFHFLLQGNFQDREQMKMQKALRVQYGRFFYRFPNGESAADVYDRITGSFHPFAVI